MKVLIIDDSKVFHSYIRTLLENHFSHLLLFFSSSGKEGLAVYEEQKPEIVLLDIFMPGIDGLEVLQRIREEDSQVQIIIISMSQREDLLEKAFALGANDYIEKGPRPREMVARIRRAVESQKEIRARQQAEEELRQEKKILEDVTFNANCGLLLLDKEKRIRYANGIASHWFGSFSELMGRSYHQVLQIDDADCIASRVFREKRPLRKEYALPEGRILYNIASPIFDRNGEIHQLSIVLVDISFRKEMEKSLQQAEKNIRQVNETFLRFGWDHDANIQKIVEAAAVLSGADFGFYNEIVGSRLCIREAYNPPEGMEREDAAQGHICNYVVEKGQMDPVLIKDLEHSSFAETDPGVKALGLHTYLGFPVQVEKQVVGVLCTLFTGPVDPSESLMESLGTLARGLGIEVERKKTMASLHRFRSALDSSADAIFLIHYQNMTFLDVNQEACDSLGYSREELLSMGPHDIKPFYDVLQLQKVFESLIQGQERDGVIETVHQRKDGSRFPVEVFIRSYRDQEQDLLIASVRDISERKKAQEEIQKRVEFETLISSLSTYFINLPVEKIDEGILQGLKQICKFTSFEGGDIYLLSEDGKSASLRHSWPPKEVEGLGEWLLLEDLPEMISSLKKMETIPIPSVKNLPLEMEVEKKQFLEEGLSSLILVPLFRGENLMGILKFNNYQEDMCHFHSTIPLFQITRSMFVNAMERKKAELKLQNELEKAKELKESLFSTTLPAVPGVEVSGILRQASHVGGDYYNCYQIGDELFFLLVDVTGHGLDAALVTVFVSTFFRREMENWTVAPDPLTVLQLLNNDFKQQGFPDDYFLEVFLGVFSPTTRDLHYAVAGAIRSLIFHPTDPSRDLPCHSGSLVHNLISFPQFGSGQLSLDAGESLLLFTDGVDELLIIRDQELGEGLMRRHIKDLFGLLPSRELLERAVDDALYLLKRKQPPDDMSILGLFSYHQRQEQEYRMPRELEAVEETLGNILTDLTAISIDLHLVRMALHEALINAVLYSTGKGPISIQVAVDAYRLTIIVDDGGRGFDWRRVQAQPQEFLAPREGGRGLDIMKKATHAMAYNSGGNLLALGWMMEERETGSKPRSF